MKFLVFLLLAAFSAASTCIRPSKWRHSGIDHEPCLISETILFNETFAGGRFNEKWFVEKGHWNSAPGIEEKARWKFGTKEIQFCTSEALSFNDGKMQITATALPNGTYNSARIYTDFAAKPKEGNTIRVEAKMKLPAGGKGIWPAFWMLPKSPAYGIWPNSGEIDIAEFNTDMGLVYTTLHHGLSISAGPLYQRIDPGFHTFTMDWSLDSIIFSLDGKVYKTVPKSRWNFDGKSDPFDQEFFILINLSIGGWAGNPNRKTVFPQVMTIEYVKVSELVFE